MADHHVVEDEQTAYSSAGTSMRAAGSHTGEMGAETDSQQLSAGTGAGEAQRTPDV